MWCEAFISLALKMAELRVITTAVNSMPIRVPATPSL